MSRRNSGYARKPRDLYETPEWVTLAIKPYIPEGAIVWEPACASGKIARVLAPDHLVYASDLVCNYDQGVTDRNFLEYERLPELWNSEDAELDPAAECVSPSAIVTNPPFNRAAEKFIRHGIKLLAPVGGFMAMLLPVDFDSGKTRRDMFSDCGGYAGKLVLTSRIVWFDPPPGAKGKSPTENHAWFMWDWGNPNNPTIRYHFKE